MRLYEFNWAVVNSAEITDEVMQDAVMHQKLLEDAKDGWEGRFVYELTSIADSHEPLHLVVQENQLKTYRKTHDGMLPSHRVERGANGVVFSGLVGIEPMETDYDIIESVASEDMSEFEEYVRILNEREDDTTPELPPSWDELQAAHEERSSD